MSTKKLRIHKLLIQARHGIVHAIPYVKPKRSRLRAVWRPEHNDLCCHSLVGWTAVGDGNGCPVAGHWIFIMRDDWQLCLIKIHQQRNENHSTKRGRISSYKHTLAQLQNVGAVWWSYLPRPPNIKPENLPNAALTFIDDTSQHHVDLEFL